MQAAVQRIVGVVPPARGAVLHAWLCANPPSASALILCASTKQAETLAEDLSLFSQAAPAPQHWDLLVLPEMIPDAPPAEAEKIGTDRLTVFSRLASAGDEKTRILVCSSPRAVFQNAPSPSLLHSREVLLKTGAGLPFQQLLRLLEEFDYDNEALCEAPGHYAVRGGIIDIYPLTAEHPVRLDFFGDDLEEIRRLDPISQRSEGKIPEIRITGRVNTEAAGSHSGLSHFPRDLSLIFVEPAELDKPLSELAVELERPLLPEAFDQAAQVLGLCDLDEETACLGPLQAEPLFCDSESLEHHRSYPTDTLLAHERLDHEERARERFLSQLARWKEQGAQVLYVIQRDAEEKRAREILGQQASLAKPRPHFVRGGLCEGFRIHIPATDSGLPGTPAARSALLSTGGPALVVVTETELFGRRRVRRTQGQRKAQVQRHQVDQLLDFSELVEGDPVVHLQHGIALYRGLGKISTSDGERESISLEFDDGVLLHVPLQESHLISRYVGLSKTRPQLGKVGSNRWEKTRKAAEKATVDLAAELLRLHAMREAQPGHAFEPDTEWQDEFEAGFPHVETPDQLKAIAETKADMQRSRPMDRLICGDVGYGKTEVAIRAAFKAVEGNRQVAVLVPTTVLAQQHLNSFRERMAGYPVAIEMISRFRTRAETGRILAATATGKVDILIGTHRLLQEDVDFKNLGLVIVDEEQRFGVKHKENLKRLRATVDFLTMSATPIPRTLYMALTGARDMSVIETPPTNRLPIQTIVKTYEEKVVREAISHELGRGGQVFYLHNRVQTIEAVAEGLRKMLPGVRVAVGHGQMDASRLERVMTDFVAGNQDVLVCTTIIESGLDIPNCNTLIIEGADRFGLSQLYQIRGRVGRFRHQAYAYLLLHRHTRLMDIARQRLSALRQHSHLGAGFRIAMRDLELRGAGNLLGAEQSGHIVGVGFDLYCQLLRQSVARLKGEQPATRIRASVKLDFVFLGDGTPLPPAKKKSYEDSYTAIRDAEYQAAGAIEVAQIQARIPASYIQETRLRIDFYRRLALAEEKSQLNQVVLDMKDRFGEFGNEIKALILITDIRLLAEQKGVSLVETDGNRLKLCRASGRRDDWILLGTRFPRLTTAKPLLRLREIVTFLNNLP